jgi:putative transposase
VERTNFTAEAAVGATRDKSGVDQAVWDEAVAREAVIRPIADEPKLGRAVVNGACRKLGLRRTRFYELLQAYRARPATSSLLPDARGGSPGISYLQEPVDAAVSEAIKSFYRKPERPTVAALHREVRRLCLQRGLVPPCWHTVRARVRRIDPAALAADREGAAAAEQRFKPVPGAFRADHALAVVQIDHTLVDLIVVDSRHRRPIQRPWVTLAIDVASRMVAGFHLTLEPPSVTSVALAIQQLVLPKAEWLAARGIAGEWPVAGLPDAIHVDNAKEFRSQALLRGAQEHGIELIHRPVATPRYGGHIERLIGTMMGAVHLLPGTTQSDIEARGAYDSAAHAAMTLDELERWLGLEVIRYHASLHSGIGLPPTEAWGDALARRPRPLRQPYDREAFVIDFLPGVHRTVRRDGLHLFGLRYWDDILSLWAGRLDRPLLVAYDPRDLSSVFVRGPDGSFWPIRLADLTRPAITLFEHRQARAELSARGLAAVDEALIFETVLSQRALVDDAVRATKAARRQGERLMQGQRQLQERAPQQPAATPDVPHRAQDDAGSGLYEVEIWS